jgi:hypothetical protein
MTIVAGRGAQAKACSRRSTWGWISSRSWDTNGMIGGRRALWPSVARPRSLAWRSSALVASRSDGILTPIGDFRHRLTAQSFRKLPSQPASCRSWPHAAYYCGVAQGRFQSWHGPCLSNGNGLPDLLISRRTCHAVCGYHRPRSPIWSRSHPRWIHGIQENSIEVPHELATAIEDFAARPRANRSLKLTVGLSCEARRRRGY